MGKLQRLKMTSKNIKSIIKSDEFNYEEKIDLIDIYCYGNY